MRTVEQAWNDFLIYIAKDKVLEILRKVADDNYISHDDFVKHCKPHLKQLVLDYVEFENSDDIEEEFAFLAKSFVR